MTIPGCYVVLCHYCQLFEPETSSSQPACTPSKPRGTPRPLTNEEMRSQGFTCGDWAVWTLFNLSLMGCVVLGYASVFVRPPAKYPDLWPLAVSVYSAAHFAIFDLYFHYYQFMYNFSHPPSDANKKNN